MTKKNCDGIGLVSFSTFFMGGRKGPFFLLTTVGDVADHDYDFCYRARGYDNSECVQYDACYGAAGWVAAEEVRTSLRRILACQDMYVLDAMV